VLIITLIAVAMIGMMIPNVDAAVLGVDNTIFLEK